MMELYKYYFILFLTDYSDQTIFISNTDPLTYSPDIACAKLYENVSSVDNDILSIHDKIDTIIKNTDVVHFYKGYVKKNTENKEILIEWREEII